MRTETLTRVGFAGIFTIGVFFFATKFQDCSCDKSRAQPADIGYAVNSEKTIKLLGPLQAKIRDHQSKYSNVNSYSHSYNWSRMDMASFKPTRGELLIISNRQSLPKKYNQTLNDLTHKLQGLNTDMWTQDDQRLVEHIRHNWIRYPSGLPYKLQQPERRDHSMGQSLVVDHLLEGKKGGFFIECGALDGETRSNSLFFERYRDWNGLLIEADPINYQQALRRNRKAFLVPACIAGVNHSQKLTFKFARNRGKLTGSGTPVQCFPLFSLLLAINQTTIDYFSLDVEGAELQVLKTIPFDKVDIRVLTVEFSHTKEGKKELTEFMFSKGYVSVIEVKHPNRLAYDMVFVNIK